MDRKKKRGKHSGGAASEAESIAGQPEDVHLRQREAVSAKKVAVGCGPNNDSPSQASLPSMPWSYTQHLLAHHIFQQPAHAAMPQPPTQTQQPATAQRGQQGGTQQPSPPGQPSQVPELSGQSTGVGCNPFHPVSADSNHDGVHNLSGTTAPHNFPGGFVFPPPPYPGQWDPLSLWMHQVHQQAFYPYSFLGNRGGYPYPNPATSVQTNQRGFIKAPPSLSQKHHRLWEMQSTENMQLWATIARAEAEISCQRGKILKLEANLQTMKAHQDALLEASKCADVPQPVRRGRAKRTATAPVAIVGLPASQPSAARTPFRKARGKISKVDLAKNIKEVDSEKLKSTLVDNIPGVIDRSSQDQVQKSSPLTVGLNGSESGPNTNSDKDVVGSQHAVNHRLYEEMANVNSRNDSQNSPSRPHLPIKESYGQQNMETKEACIASLLKSEANRAQQAVVSGDCSIKSELMGMSRRDDWSEANGNDLARNALLGGLLHEQYNSSSLGTSNAISSAKMVPDWHYAVEDGSGEQDDAVASGQDEEEAGDNVETTLDAIGGGKTSNYFVLNPEAAISKELTALGRWRV